MNKVFLVGRVAAEPQGSITSTGNTMSRISIACQDNFNKNEVYFFPCVAWQNQAKFINTYVKKGDLIAIDGKLTRKAYVNKDGVNVYSTDVVIETVKIMSSSQNKNLRTNDYQEDFVPENNSKLNDVVFEDNSTMDAGNYVESSPSPQNNEPKEEEMESVDLDWISEIDNF